MVVTVLANTLDAQSMLLQVVKILWELHLEIVCTGVQELPFGPKHKRAFFTAAKHNETTQTADVSEEQHLYHCDNGRTRISHERRKQLLRGS